MKQNSITVYALSAMAAMMLLASPTVPAMAETKPTDIPATKPATKVTAPATTTTTAEFDTVKTHTLDNYQVKLPAVFPAPEHEMRELKNASGETLGNLSLYKAMYKYAAFLSSMSPSATTEPAKANERLEAAKKTFLSRKVNPEELSSRALSVQGHPAIEFQVKAGLSPDKPGTMVYTRAMDVLITPDKFYQFVFLSDKQSDLTAPWVNRYFESISFTK